MLLLHVSLCFFIYAATLACYIQTTNSANSRLQLSTCSRYNYFSYVISGAELYKYREFASSPTAISQFSTFSDL